MRALANFAIFTWAALASVEAQESSFLLKPFEGAPGQTVVIQAKSLAKGGKVTIVRGSQTQNGTMSIQRDRTYERTVTEDSNQQLQYKILIDQISTSMDIGEGPVTDSVSGALVGHTAKGVTDSMNRWRFFLQGETANNRQAIELAELESYENRRWFLDGPVKVGETWPIEPSFLRHLIERDLGTSQMEASMTLESVGIINNERTAVLSIRVKTLGQQERRSPDAIAGASVSLQGTLHLALDSMLDRKMTLQGSLSTSSNEGDKITQIVLPVNYTVTKTLK